MVPSSSSALERFLVHLEALFSISINDIRDMISRFHEDMQNGLADKDSSLKMLPSFVDVTTGREQGKFMALDLGGSNLRVLLVTLNGKGATEVSAVSKFAVPEQYMQGSGTALFDFIAECIHAFALEHHVDPRKPRNLALTFSFPVNQTAVKAGTLIVWTKGFTATGVAGKDIVRLLEEALKRRQLYGIHVAALTNDTVGTLMNRRYSDPSCDLGVIMGTGTNACYREVCGRIHKLKSPAPHDHMIINMEWGNFDKLYQTGYDQNLDALSVNPGAMFLEKMVSGMYLGEMVRIVLMDLIQSDLLFLDTPDVSSLFEKSGGVSTAHMSEIQSDQAPHLDKVDTFLKKSFGVGSRVQDRRALQRICQMVSTRAARLGAGAMAAVITWMDPQLIHPHTIAVDGSLYEKYTGFAVTIADTLKALYGEKADALSLVQTQDGSGVGAAIVAAVAASSRRQA